MSLSKLRELVMDREGWRAWGCKESDTTEWLKWTELKKVKEESEKVGFKLNIQKIKIMASGPITSWKVDGETMETVTEFVLEAPKSLQMVTAAVNLKDACSLEEKLWPT